MFPLLEQGAPGSNVATKTLFRSSSVLRSHGSPALYKERCEDMRGAILDRDDKLFKRSVEGGFGAGRTGAIR